ncbi:MAG: tRNA (adenosine(37)-N6)-threonylcarbamoyltransferase complex ATPase subunit type 1 TsaE [Anaerolineae bacterium]|nr:tRNA (adenosine(37)-N6)-threonylcarbamoyltransferase complex ATPase subunit type 1 TsaE [Anaerolineae bacterium]NUQ03204.1 tRNA (adenosine(37)-N6)-threonylcarbamoyltransferase complex ATPase subunit type 1 TsaE [Anaerolineae bacterium]
MPILRQDELDLISHSAEQTRRLGVRLGTLLRPGDVICLSGEMGAGKTAFAAGVGAGWGADTVVNSPTFSLVHEHRRQQDQNRLLHIDCYRLNSEDEADTLGLDDLFDEKAAVLIEWPERIASLLPKERLWVDLRIFEAARRNLLFIPSGTRYEALLESFRGDTVGVKRP